MNTKWKILEEKIGKLSDSVKILKRENNKLEKTIEELSIEHASLEEENKMAKKFLKDKETVKSKVKAILENMERAEI